MPSANTKLSSLLESILFVASRPLSVKELSKLTDTSNEDIENHLGQLQIEKANSGIVLLCAGDRWQMATHADNTNVVRTFLQSDLKEKLSDAALEVLAIISYRQPIGRSEIEAIRGVNCQYTLRTLLMRGLIERTGEARGRYQVTTDFLQHMGLQKVNDLPEYEINSKKIRVPETPEKQTEIEEDA